MWVVASTSAVNVQVSVLRRVDADIPTIATLFVGLTEILVRWSYTHVDLRVSSIQPSIVPFLVLALQIGMNSFGRCK